MSFQMASNLVRFSDPTIHTIESGCYDDVLRVIIQFNKLNDVWYAETSLPLLEDEAKDPWHWDMPPRKIDPTRVYPAFNAVNMIIADENTPGYEKKPSLLQAGNFLFEIPILRDVTFREIHVCEALRPSRHPNICFYRGVQIESSLVTSLMFDRYHMTLREFLYKGHHIDIPRCTRDIRNGIQHMHSLGFVHCDIKPDNIFVDLQNQRFVVGGFDSVHCEGARLNLKVGTVVWVPKGEETADLARYQIDWYNLDMIKVWLEAKKAFGRDAGVRDQQEEGFWTTNILGNARMKAKAQLLDIARPPFSPDPSPQEKNQGNEMDTSW
jgi:serine/threonine protein kinase